MNIGSVSETDLAERFEAERPRLVRLAYGHLGSLAEAEDVVQDAWLRLERVDPGEIRDLQGWLTTVVSRLALDALRSARVRREAYVGPWLPEPLVQEPGPEGRAERAEDVSLALLVVLESLSASERIAFVLHDVFGYSFDEVSAALGTSSSAARQQASRARKAVEARRPRFPATPEQQHDVVAAFGRAARGGDIDALLEILHPDVVFTSDGGGRVNAARKPIEGATRVARLTNALWTRGSAGATYEIFDINGMPGYLGKGADGAVTVMSFTVDDGRIVAIDVQRNPEKLRGVPRGDMTDLEV
jgi:RNA polymerase sigma-70 factor (ECF subfamily)